MKRKHNALFVGVLCLLLGLGATRGLADISSWSTSAASNTSAIGTEGMSESALPSTVNDSYREGLAQITRLARQAVLATFGPSTVSGNAYYITPALTPSAAISGQIFSFVPTSTNTGSATLRVGTVAAKTIVKLSNSTLASGDLQAGSLATVVDDGTFYKLLNPYNLLTSNAVTFSNIATGTTGSLITFDASQAAAAVTPGETGKFLKSRGNASTPVWDTLTTVSAATQSEVEAGSSNSVYVAPQTVRFHPAVPKAWVQFDGTLATLIGPSYGATASKIGTGTYRVSFTTPMSTLSYFALPIGASSSVGAGGESYRGTVRWTTGYQVGTYSSGGSLTDYDDVNIIFMGDQ